MSKRKKITLRKITQSISKVVIQGLLGSFIPELLGGIVKDYLDVHLHRYFKPILFVVLGLVLLYQLITDLFGDEEPINPLPTPIQDNRLEFLKNLRQLYTDRLKGKMMNDLHFELKLKMRYTTEGTDPQTVEDLFIIKDNAPTGDFDRLFKDYTKKLWRLLILGEPGAGKSILLLRFALRLLDMAEKDKNFPIPVLLDLASWKDPNQPFADWLEKNLPYMGGSFAVGKEDAKRLVASNALLPLLDGFDEIKEVYRDSCFQQLMPYLDKLKTARLEPLPEVIVCSRIVEYTEAEDAPVFASLKIQPLTRTDINQALRPLLKENFPQAKRLQQALQENPALYPAITSAFLVHILLDLYKQEQADFGALDAEVMQKAITQRYLQSELDKITDFPKEKAKRWLGWLAWMLKYVSGSITFELIDLQPSWTRRKFTFGLVCGLFFGLVVALVFGLVVALDCGQVVGLIAVLAVVQVVGLDYNEIETKEIQVFKLANLTWKIVKIILFSGLVFGLILFVFWVVTVVLFDVLSDGLVDGLVDGLAACLVVGLVTGLAAGLVVVLLENQSFPKIGSPYIRFRAQYWRDVLQHSISFSLVFGLLRYYVDNTYSGFIFGPLFGPLSAGLTSPLLRHFCLRLVLTLDHTLPLCLVTFLDHVSANTGLLMKDGGQWRFRHQLILDELADLFEATHPNLLRPAHLEVVKKERRERQEQKAVKDATENKNSA